MATTVYLPVYKHGAKVLKICRAPPIFRKYFLKMLKNQQLTVLDRNEYQSQEIISTETEINRYFPLITNPHNAGICVGLCRYMHWAMQVYALSYAGICDEGCSRLRGALEVMWRDNVTIYNIKTRGNGN